MEIKKLPDKFEEIEKHPKFKDFPLRIQKEIREDWVKEKYKRSYLYGNRKYLKDLEDEAFATAPDWMKPHRPTPFYKKPEVSVIPDVLFESAIKTLRLPQQIIASYIDQALHGPPQKTVVDSLYKPLERVAKWLEPEGEEFETKLPGGLVTETLTDPLVFVPALKTVSGVLQRHRELKALPNLIKEIGKKKVMTPSETKKFSAEWRKEMLRDPQRIASEKTVLEDVLPKAYKRLSPEQRSIYLEARRLGSPHIPPSNLREFARDVANLSEREANLIIDVLSSGKQKDINKIIKWSEQYPFERKPIEEVLFGAKKGAKKTTSTKVTPPKTTTSAKPQPGDYLKYLEEPPKF